MTKPLKAGDLNREVKIERVTEVADGQGGWQDDWSELRTAYAAASPIAGKEALVNDTLRSSQGWRVTMRFVTDLTVKDRIRLVDAGRTWLLNIQSIVDPYGRRDRIVLLCEGKPA